MPEQARSLGAENPPNWLQAAAEGSPMTQAAFREARRAMAILAGQRSAALSADRAASLGIAGSTAFLPIAGVG